MKQSKLRPNEKVASKEKLCESELKNNSKCVNETCIQILAWLLLTIGLCIIAVVVFTALEKTTTNYEDTDSTEDKSLESGVVSEWKPGKEDEIDPDLDISGNFDFSIQTLGRLLTPTTSKERCVQMSCRVLCSDNRNVYEDTAVVMNGSLCGVITSLILSNQSSNCIENKWKSANLPVLKILLTDSQFTKLKSGAFNSPMFAKVFHMVWMSLELKELSDGVLLGLYSLRKLEINTPLPITRMTFLQPVQTKLEHLKLNAGISFNSNASIFEDIYFEKLIHLDLSHNRFSGPLSKRLFSGTPNIMYLRLRYCLLSEIEDDAFQDIAHNLKIVNLAHNLFKTIRSEVFLPQSNALSNAFFEVEPNNWHCNCELQSLKDFYDKHASSFMSVPYCRMPYNLFGTNFEDLHTDDLSCNAETAATSTTDEMIIEIVNPTTLGLISIPYEQDLANDTLVTSATPYGPILQFSCSQAIDLDNYMRDSNNTQYKRIFDVDEDNQTTTHSSGTFVFEPPNYDLNLELYDNRSVRAWIPDYQDSAQLNIIWFTEKVTADDSGEDESSAIDYNCMQYENPQLIIPDLQESHTYTFCMIPKDEIAISPLNCQPLYVPVKLTSEGGEDDDETPNNGKQFTVAMLCLIFFCSTVFGAIIAYLGIKAYPDLLEGSKNVLVIKELDKTCYISTISDSEFKKNPLKIKNSGESSKIYNPLHNPNADISRLNSFQSTVTNFESSFSNSTFQSDEYEMPKQLNFQRNEYSTFNSFETSPNFPPPLPKRNSNISMN